MRQKFFFKIFFQKIFFFTKIFFSQKNFFFWNFVFRGEILEISPETRKFRNLASGPGFQGISSGNGENPPKRSKPAGKYSIKGWLTYFGTKKRMARVALGGDLPWKWHSFGVPKPGFPGFGPEPEIWPFPPILTNFTEISHSDQIFQNFQKFWKFSEISKKFFFSQKNFFFSKKFFFLKKIFFSEKNFFFWKKFFFLKKIFFSEKIFFSWKIFFSEKNLWMMELQKNFSRGRIFFQRHEIPKPTRPCPIGQLWLPTEHDHDMIWAAQHLCSEPESGAPRCLMIDCNVRQENALYYIYIYNIRHCTCSGFGCRSASCRVRNWTIYC